MSIANAREHLIRTHHLIAIPSARADLGAKGVFFRLRIGPFASSADAKSFCDGLKTRGQDCLVKSK
jgi:hypothetical protein